MRPTESDSRQQLPLTHLYLGPELTYIMQKELINRSGFLLCKNIRGHICKLSLSHFSQHSWKAHRKEALTFLTQFHLQLPEALSSLTSLNICMELPPWPCTGTAQRAKFWVQRGSTWLAGPFFEDNRMEILLFRAVSEPFALLILSTFRRTYRSHFSEAGVFLYP